MNGEKITLVVVAYFRRIVPRQQINVAKGFKKRGNSTGHDDGVVGKNNVFKLTKIESVDGVGPFAEIGDTVVGNKDSLFYVG